MIFEGGDGGGDSSSGMKTLLLFEEETDDVLGGSVEVVVVHRWWWNSSCDVVGGYSIAHLQQMLVEQVLEQEEQMIGLFELVTAAAPYLLFLQLKIPGFQLWPSIHYILNHHLN
ncbi:hypothetical protein HanIR_Chr05g0218531 [Helianthus annuus]|nr:hypothetical protein HanIR_Chr05g0218531 [Helianthus annuus]